MKTLLLERFELRCNYVILYSVGKENPWLMFAEDHNNELVEPVFLELHATAMLCLPSGECMCPDATICTTLMSALYSSVNDEIVSSRQLTVCYITLISLSMKIDENTEQK